MPPFGILRHRIVQRTKPLTSNRRATLRNPEAPNCTGTQPLARNRRATPLLRSPRLVGTVCCRTSSAPNKKMKYLDSWVATVLLILNGHSGSSPSPCHHHHYHHHHHHHHQHAIWPASSFLNAAAWAPASSHPHLSSASDAASGARLGCGAARAARPRPHLVRLTKRCGPSASSAACGWCGSRALADFSIFRVRSHWREWNLAAVRPHMIIC